MRPRALIAASVLIFLFAANVGVVARQGPLPDCEWCGTDEAPDRLSSTITIAPPDEPGDRLILAGTVYRSDGKTPAANIILYLYHTNVGGIYPKRGNETGNGRRHGYLRGWLKTGADGRYVVNTIRPGSYPSRSEPAHIHMTVKEPGKAEYWIASTKFAGDPLLEADADPAGIITLKRGEDGVWRGQRDVVLKN